MDTCIHVISVRVVSSMMCEDVLDDLIRLLGLDCCDIDVHCVLFEALFRRTSDGNRNKNDNNNNNNNNNSNNNDNVVVCINKTTVKKIIIINNKSR